ncbi:Protein of unknown function [Bacillus wiedmannii]|uniref:Uncharacterized protein n=1 Tax=Bacillus wiedmannii TaxID=1890302 RepID=A0AB37YVB3_9BACI|nr:Protein of unknown function [Bacillus wiedmannii]
MARQRSPDRDKAFGLVTQNRRYG